MLRSQIATLLDRAVSDGCFPGCVGAVWRGGCWVYFAAHGTLVYGDAATIAAKVDPSTIYDLASLTKPLCTTTLAAMAVSEGRISLDSSVPARWNRACPGATLRDLLEHCSGMDAHREFFSVVAPFSAEGVLDEVACTDPVYQRRSRALYSDLGFLVLGSWLEDVFGEGLAAVFRQRVSRPLGLSDAALGFRLIPPPLTDSSPRLRCAVAPTEVYELQARKPNPSYAELRRRCVSPAGQVHDDNAFVMGGVAGHAGLFGNAEAVVAVARAWIEGSLPGLESEVARLFWTRSAVPGSTRRCGFNGLSRANMHRLSMSAGAVGHSGFTGTSMWIDPNHPAGSLVSVLLSNRVHPARTNERIRLVRPEFHRLASAAP